MRTDPPPREVIEGSEYWTTPLPAPSGISPFEAKLAGILNYSPEIRAPQADKVADHHAHRSVFVSREPVGVYSQRAVWDLRHV